MSRYRQTMSELLEQVRAPKESADYLMPKLNPSQINNIKKTWSMKTAKDITPAIRDMIKKMDIPTQMAIKQAKINQLSKLVEEEYLPEFNDSMIQTLKKEYEPMRNKTISVTNANKLGALFTRFDSNKNALEKLYGADIPFISTMAMTRLMTKHGYKADKLNKIRKEELDLLEEAELLGEGTGKITGFRDNKEKSNMVSLAKQHSLKVKDIPGGIELSGNMRKILDMQLAVRSHLKTEEIDEGRMSDIDAMRKRGASAAEIAKELKIDVKAVKAILGEEVEEEEEEKEPKKEEPKDDKEKLKAEIEKKDNEIAMLKTKAETEKAKVAKKETEKLVNPETGEPLLQIGVAYKHLKDKMAKEEVTEMKKDDAYAIGMAQAKKVMNDEPPLQKKTIKKGHEIADKILKKEETIKEFKKMSVTIRDMDKRKKAITDLQKQNLGVAVHGGVIKVDGKGKDLNNFAKDLMNFYGANVKAEGTMIGGIVTDNSGKKMPNYDKAKKALKDFMSKPQPAKGASDKVMSFIFDDELLDDLYSAEKKNMSDVRPMVKKRLKALGIKENAPTLSDLERLKKQGMKPKKEETQHNLAKMKYEQIAGLKKKAEKSGMPYSILKKVYDRGMAAWRGGHRPGTTQQQWAFARVNSFVTKSSGTWGGADKDLAKQVRGK